MSNPIIDIAHQKEKANLPQVIKSTFSLKFILELIAALCILFSIFWEIRVETIQHEWNVKVATFKFLSERDRSHWDYTERYFKDSSVNEDWFEYIKSNDSLQFHIRKQLILFENIGIGEQIHLFDKEIIKSFIGTDLIGFYDHTKSWIEYSRIKNHKPQQYLDYEKCVQDLKNIKD